MELIQKAKTGGPREFGDLLERFRGWLLLLARLEIDGDLQAKVDPQDLVQETLLQACRDRESFRGTTEVELGKWTRGILAHVIAHEVRRWKGSKKRGVELEVAIDQSLGRSSQNMGKQLVTDTDSPGTRAIREEESFILARAIMSLPEDHQEVIVLRGLKGLNYEQVAQRLEKSSGAVRMIWLRALARLKEEVARWNR